jgi:hypothetical protein
MRVGLALTIALVLLVIHPSGQSPLDQMAGVRHYSGETVAPVFEGWEKNADGSFNLVFGYLNRNYEEEPEIPIGAANSFSPGPADRGQPSHFYPRRQQFMFKVHVPADFGKQELVWTLTRNGHTEKAVAHLALEFRRPFQLIPARQSRRLPAHQSHCRSRQRTMVSHQSRRRVSQIQMHRHAEAVRRRNQR